MSRISLNLSRYQVADNDAPGFAVHNHQIKHFPPGIELNAALVNLTAQGRISSKQQLLARLPSGIKSAGNLSSAEGTIVEQTTVFPGKRNALGYALVDDTVGNLGQAVNVGFAGAIVSSFYGIVKQTINRITVVLIIFSGIDTSLCGDGVCTTGRILNTEIQHIEAQLTKCGCSGSSRQTCAHHNYIQTTLVGGIYQLLLSLVI